MLQELEDLTNALDSIPEDDARSILNHINTKLKGVLNADIVDVMYREEARENTTILRPLSSIVTPGSRSEAIPWAVTALSKGIWPRVYLEKIPVWLEGITKSRQTQNAVQNMAPGAGDRSEVPPEDVQEIYQDTDSLVCLPLVFEQTLVGIFCVELSRSGVISVEIFKFMKRLASSYACLAWKVANCRVNQKQTNRAVENFRGLVTQSAIREHISVTGTGVMLRPFGHEFNEIEASLTHEFERHGIGLEPFVAGPGRPIVNDLKIALRLAPFAVVDITGLNPNVLIELGMVNILGKEVMLLCRKEDVEHLPLDITTEQVDDYVLIDEAYHVETVAGKPMLLSDRVNEFIEKLRTRGLV